MQLPPGPQLVQLGTSALGIRALAAATSYCVGETHRRQQAATPDSEAQRHDLDPEALALLPLVMTMTRFAFR